MAIFTYKKVITGESPNTTTLGFKFVPAQNATDKPIELAEINGKFFVFVPDAIINEIPTQDTEVEFTLVDLTDTLKEEIKTNSPIVKLINDAFNIKLREKYSLDDEQFFSRIGIGVALGIYTYQTGEEQALIEFGTFVENLRTEKRAEFAKIGL